MDTVSSLETFAEERDIRLPFTARGRALSIGANTVGKVAFQLYAMCLLCRSTSVQIFQHF